MEEYKDKALLEDKGSSAMAKALVKNKKGRNAVVEALVADGEGRIAVVDALVEDGDGRPEVVEALVAEEHGRNEVVEALVADKAGRSAVVEHLVADEEGRSSALAKALVDNEEVRNDVVVALFNDDKGHLDIGEHVSQVLPDVEGFEWDNGKDIEDNMAAYVNKSNTNSNKEEMKLENESVQDLLSYPMGQDFKKQFPKLEGFTWENTYPVPNIRCLIQRLLE